VTSFETGVLKVRLSTREKLRIKFLTRNVLRAKAVIVTSVTLSSKVLLWIPASIAGRSHWRRNDKGGGALPAMSAAWRRVGGSVARGLVNKISTTQGAFEEKAKHVTLPQVVIGPLHELLPR
jgi:hypothetical protein